MTLRRLIRFLAADEDLNFLLTNRIPRRLATRFMGRFSQVRTPPVPWLSIRLWRLFCDVDLADARDTRFETLHAAFIRALRPGARPVAAAPEVLASPCDAIVGACGMIEDRRAFQIKGFSYALNDLIPDAALCERYDDGTYATLRLTAGMYHRFHAPHDARLDEITYISGDTWNVNPVSLKRIERLFCRNERVVLPLALDAGGETVTLVAVAAILVASVRLHGLPYPLNLGYRGANRIALKKRYAKGEEIGYFEHGSTILVFAPRGFRLAEGIAPGRRLRQGEPLLLRPDAAP